MVKGGTSATRSAGKTTGGHCKTGSRSQCSSLPEVAPRFRFLLVRANTSHPDHWLVNRLISQMQPFDFVSRFLFDKQGFYAAYEQMPDKFQEEVVKTLQDTYLADKVGFRRRLYGILED